MGLLSSLLTVGGAAAGFALGGPGGASLGASLGSSVGGGIDQSHAVKKATAAQIAGEQAALQARKDAAAKVEATFAPGLATYGAGINALTGRLGVPQPSAPYQAPKADGMTTQPTSWDAMTGAQPLAAGPTQPVTGQQPSAPYDATNTDDFGAGRSPAPAAGAAAAASPVATNALTGQPAATPPQGPPAAPGVDPGTYGNTANPSYSAPDHFTYTKDDYEASPAYQYQQDEAARAVLGSASATGALQSGAALKALQDRAQNIAYQDFTGERAFAAGRSDADRSFDRGVYADDRNYLTGRYDTQTDNLFKYTGIGQQAAGVVGNAAMAVGGAGSDAALGIANAKAGSALQQGNISSGVLANVAGLGANYLTGQNKLTGDLQTAAAKNPYLF